jgi:hypothetical protein
VAAHFGVLCHRGSVQCSAGKHPQHGLATGVFGVSQIHHEIGLTKPFARTPKEGRERIGRDVEQRRCLARPQSFDLHEPKDSLPTKGECREGLSDEIVLLRAGMKSSRIPSVSQLGYSI